jgi:hypothetical protein
MICRLKKIESVILIEPTVKRLYSLWYTTSIPNVYFQGKYEQSIDETETIVKIDDSILQVPIDSILDVEFFTFGKKAMLDFKVLTMKETESTIILSNGIVYVKELELVIFPSSIKKHNIHIGNGTVQNVSEQNFRDFNFPN